MNNNQYQNNGYQAQNNGYQPQSNMNQGNNYYQQGIYGMNQQPAQPTVYQQQTQPVSQKPPQKQKKVKKKKKHIGLWIFLSIIVLVASFIGIKTWQNNVATEYLMNVLSEQPFTFSGNDYADYVTNNIEVPTEIVVGENETISVNWTSDNSNILSADGTVNRPQSQSAKVTLTATYKKGLGTGEKDFELNVIKTDTLKVEDIYVLTQEEIDKGIGKNNIDITRDENGNIETIDGDLDLTKVETEEDVMVFIDSYSDFLSINDLTFKVDNVTPTMNGKKFTCVQTQGDIPIVGKNIIIKTSADGYVFSVNVNVNRNIKNMSSVSLSEDEIANIVKNNIGEDAIVLTNEKIIYSKDNNDIVAYSVTAVSEKNGKIEELVISAQTKEIIYQNSLMSKATESVKSNGKDVFGKNQSFYINKEKNILTSYRFEDLKRNIRILDGNDIWTVLAANKATVEHPFSYISDEKDLEISNSKNDFNKYPSGISAYKNFITVYDWYSKNLNRKSFDGKGMPISCLVDFSTSEDNACFISGEFQIFAIGTIKEFNYPLSGNLDIIAHEYTHGVFGSEVGNLLYTTLELDTINEAYADIFGCLIEGNWELGENVLGENTMFRDPTFVSDAKIYNEDKVPFPTEYKGENWNTSDCHINSVVLSHVAYRMSQSGFSTQDIAKIWYNSLSYGLKSNSTFIDVRYNVERSAKELGYTEEQIELIGSLFDEVKIKEKGKFTIKNYSVDGDMIKDDTVEKDFLIVMSPIGTLFGAPINIFEVDNSLDTRYSNEDVSALMSEYLTTALNEDTDEDGIKFEINVEYSRMPQWAMDIVKDFADSARQNLLSTMSDESGMEQEEASGWLNFFFIVQHYKGTSYDFWTECLGIDLSQISFEKNK